MRKALYSIGIVTLAAAAIFVWSRTALAPSQADISTVGVAQRAAVSPAEMMRDFNTPLPSQHWDAH